MRRWGQIGEDEARRAWYDETARKDLPAGHLPRGREGIWSPRGISSAERGTRNGRLQGPTIRTSSTESLYDGKRQPNEYLSKLRDRQPGQAPRRRPLLERTVGTSRAFSPSIPSLTTPREAMSTASAADRLSRRKGALKRSQRSVSLERSRPRNLRTRPPAGDGRGAAGRRFKRSRAIHRGAADLDQRDLHDALGRPRGVRRNEHRFGPGTGRKSGPRRRALVARALGSERAKEAAFYERMEREEGRSGSPKGKDLEGAEDTPGSRPTSIRSGRA